MVAVLGFVAATLAAVAVPPSGKGRASAIQSDDATLSWAAPSAAQAVDVALTGDDVDLVPMLPEFRLAQSISREVRQEHTRLIALARIGGLYGP